MKRIWEWIKHEWVYGYLKYDFQIALCIIALGLVIWFQVWSNLRHHETTVRIIDVQSGIDTTIRI